MDFTQFDVEKLVQISMLHQAKQYSIKYNYKTWFANNSYSQRQNKDLVKNHSVWLDLYPPSTITKQNQSILDVYSNPNFLKILSQIGIKVIHTNPMQQAGSITNSCAYTESVDGGYDRISYGIDKSIGTNKQYQVFVNNAAKYKIYIAGDIIPGHTGFGPDFILALLNYKEYPSLYMMHEIASEDWGLLPSLDDNKTQNFPIKTINLSKEYLNKLIEKEYIPGYMTLDMFHEPGIKETNWSVSEEVKGVDGVTRRWLYLHWFKQGQPSLDWLNPSFTAHQLLAGDILHHRFNLGTKILRIDANCLLGLEKVHDSKELWGSGHPLSGLSTKQLSMLMRKCGGYSYEENNSELENYFSDDNLGPDLSYDFALRTGYIHAIATSNTSLLKIQQKLVDEHKVDYASLIHAMQNHDNLCYELVHFDKYPDKEFYYNNENLTGAEIKEIIFNEVQEFCDKNNLSFKINYGGIQAHFVELCAARLNINKQSITDGCLSSDEFESIEKLMLLAVFYNAIQPGVFQISAWDLLGVVNFNGDHNNKKIIDGDSRWLCRSGFDLNELDQSFSFESERMTNNHIGEKVIGGYSMFDSLYKQIDNPESFVVRASKIIKLRESLKIANGSLYKIINTSNKSVNIVVFYLAENKHYCIVVNNFSDDKYDFKNDIDEFIANKVTINKYLLNGSIIDSAAEHFDFYVTGLSGCVIEMMDQ